MKSKSVIVVGSGIIGLSCAYYLNQRGFDVTVIDQCSEEHHGTSFGNAGMVVPSHFIPLAAPGMIQMGLRMLPNRKSPFGFHVSLNPELIRWVLRFIRSCNPAHVESCASTLRDLNLASRVGYEEITEVLGAGLGFEKRGLFMLCKEQKTLDEEAHVAEKANQIGLHAKVWDRKHVSEIDPDIEMDIIGAVHFEDDCQLSTIDFMNRMRAHLVEKGVRFAFNASVKSFDVKSINIESIRTTAGDFEADEVILATGSWSQSVANELGLRIPIQPGKGYSMTLENPVQLPRVCSLLTEARVAITPMNGQLRVAGTMEIGASESGVNRNRVQGIIDSVPKYFPAFKAVDFADQPIWSGLRPCSPDGMPYIGRTSSLKNLTVATGHSMMGWSLGPVTGKLIGEILSGEKPSIDLKKVNPDRFN